MVEPQYKSTKIDFKSELQLSQSDFKMNQTCKVCGEPAAGFHFGAFTCEGCKSFFGRSYNNSSSIHECKNNNKCIINKKNRTSCKSCRLRKCLNAGMSKSGSRYGRRSNWFKIHCLLQEQQQRQLDAAGNQQDSPGQGTQSLEVPSISPFPSVVPSRSREEQMLLLKLEEMRHSAPGSLGSPESHKSDSSLEFNEARRVPPVLSGILPPPPTFIPHPALLFNHAVCQPFYQGLLPFPYAPPVRNNNDHTFFTTTRSFSSNNRIAPPTIDVGIVESRRNRLDELLELQRNSPCTSPGSNEDEDEDVDVSNEESPIQESPIDLSKKSSSERESSSPTNSEHSSNNEIDYDRLPVDLTNKN
ncbi:hypothetical protein ABEB36_001785 [Hypothenemus hampei]|uniref:Nuclear receptor domain-containing protein n=1 Tax=Hypothenemus hampei TaxID=57062 RepID=A0ABD1FFS1_HYPHA